MRRLLSLLLIAAGLGLLARGAVPCGVVELQPACYVALHPGPTENTLELVRIGDQTYASAGELVLTTVAVDSNLTLVDWVRGAFDPGVRQVQRRVIYPPGRDEAEVQRQNVVDMLGSQVDAAVAALRALGRDSDPREAGAEVVEIVAGSPAEAAEFQVGDVIVAVDGIDIRNNEQLLDLLAVRSIGDEISIDLLRDDDELTVTLRLADSTTSPERPVLGVIVRTLLVLPTDVRIDAGAIGGPSAGLMFALAVIDLLGEDDLTGGRVVAGTGTIDRDGRIGGVGGIQQKIIGALARGGDRRPADVFLVPRSNFGEAQGTPVGRRIVVVPVETLSDALAALTDLREDREPRGALALAP